MTKIKKIDLGKPHAEDTFQPVKKINEIISSLNSHMGTCEFVDFKKKDIRANYKVKIDLRKLKGSTEINWKKLEEKISFIVSDIAMTDFDWISRYGQRSGAQIIIQLFKDELGGK